MTTVRIVDGMKYGFKLLGIYIAMVLVGGAFVAGGAVLITLGFEPGITLTSNYSTQLTQITAGALLSVVGVLGLYGATVGLLYKFIADSVIAGLETADLEGTNRDDSSSLAGADDDTETDSQSADVFEMTDTDDESTAAADDEVSQPAVEESGGRSPTEATSAPDKGTTASARDDTTSADQRQSSPNSGENDHSGTAATTSAKSSPTSTESAGETDPTATAETVATGQDDGASERHTSEADGRSGADAGTGQMPDRDPVDPRPTSPDKRSWQADEETTTPGDADHTSGQGPAGPEADDDWEESYASEASETGGDSYEEPNDDSEELWEMSDSSEAVRENIDQVVSEATDPETADAPEPTDAETEPEPTSTGTITDTTSDVDPVTETEPTDDTDPASATDPVGEPPAETESVDETSTEESEDEPKTMDDAPGEFVAKPPVDADEDETDADETDADDAEEVPDEPITDAEIEDTTDEEGDWEPLDESDL